MGKKGISPQITGLDTSPDELNNYFLSDSNVSTATQISPVDTKRKSKLSPQIKGVDISPDELNNYFLSDNVQKAPQPSNTGQALNNTPP